MIANDGKINVYTNGLLRTMEGNRGNEILDVLNNAGTIKFLEPSKLMTKMLCNILLLEKGL